MKTLRKKTNKTKKTSGRSASDKKAMKFLSLLSDVLFFSPPRPSWLAAVAIALGIYLLTFVGFEKEHWVAGWILAGVSLCLFTRLFRPGVMRERVFLLLGPIGSILVGVGLLSFPSFGWDFPSKHSLDLPHPLLFIMSGVLALFLCFLAFRPESRAEVEISGRTAGFCLLLVLGLATWLRLCHFGDPYAMYWDDFAISMIDGRGVVDFGEHHMLFPLGDRQPFYNYLVVLMYYLFPGWNSIVIQNVTWAGIDLAATWMLYLLGKETGGRRVGLIVAAFGAVSKPFLISCLTGQSLIPTSLYIAAALFFTFRVLKTPNLRRFLEWGASIAFGAYCYQTGRPYIWLLVIIVLFLMLLDQRERAAKRPIWIMGISLAFVWTVAFLYFNNFLPLSKAVVNGWTLSLVLVGMGIWIYFLRMKMAAGRPGYKVLDWGLGVLVAGALMFPILRQADFAAHASALSIFHKDGQLQITGAALSQALQKVSITLRTVFITGFDRADMGLPGEGFFDLPSELLVILGLVYFLARPDRMRSFLFVCALFGLIPHVFSTGSDPHSGKLLGVVAPLYLLGAMGVENIFRSLKARGGNRYGFYLFLLLGLGLVGWGAWGMYQRFYVIIPARATADSLIHKQVRQDSPRCRIFLHPSPFFFSVATQGVLNEGYDVYLLRDNSNAIDVEQGAARKDVLVMLSGNDKVLIERFQKEFPMGRWEETRIYSQQPQDASFMKRIYIPAGSIPTLDPAAGVLKLLYFHEVPNPSWRRCLYAHRVGLGMGIIKFEERVADPWASIIPGSEGLLSARVEGSISIPATGHYTFSAKTGNYVVLTIGGTRVLDSRPRMRVAEVQRRIHLKAGVYPVVLLTYYQMGLEVPEILVQFPGGVDRRRLGSW